MDRIEHYREIIQQLLTEKEAQFRPFAPSDTAQFCALDTERDQYVLINTGWRETRRLHGATLYLRVENDKIWIEEDWTEEGIATELIAQGVPKEDIVLGFQPPTVRTETEFAAA